MSDFRRRFGVPVVIVLVVWSLTTHGKFSDSGDEPHYLIIAESLIADRDLDVGNNYDQGSARWFGADGLTAGLHVRRKVDGAVWSGHDIGLPVLILPVYAVATRLAAHVPEDWLARAHQTRGLFAYSLISFSLVLLTAWAAALLLSGLRRMTSERYAVGTVLALVLSPPVMGHAFLVFPETPAFAVVCAVIWLVSLRVGELTTTNVLSVVVAVGLMPWLHRKYSFLSLGLLWLIARQHWAWLRQRRPGLIAGLAALGVVPHAALHLWTLREWGHLGGGFMTEGLPFSAGGLQTGALGLILDRERGLVGYAPIFLIVPACWAFTWRATWRVVVPMLLLFLPMAAFVVWGGGFSPPARYVVPILPFLAYAAARGLEQPLIRRAAIPLLVWQAAISAYVWQHPRAMWPKELGTNQALEHIPWIGPAYARWLPSLLTGDSVAHGWLCVGVVAIATVALVAAELKRGSGVGAIPTGES
jgi:hypothetical protein